MPEMCNESKVQVTEVKTVPFMGTDLIAARDADGQIWAGVRWMCDGMGLNDNQARAERKKIQADRVISKGGVKVDPPYKRRESGCFVPETGLCSSLACEN